MTTSFRAGWIRISLTAPRSRRSTSIADRGSGSMRPTSTTVHRSFSARSRSMHCAATSAPTRSPTRWRHRRRCRWRSPRSCWRHIRAVAPPAYPIGSNARRNPDAQPLLRSFAEATARYHDGSMKYVKLLDGGLVDNYGLSGFSIGMLAAQRPFEPMTERQAVKVRRIMFLVVDAGRGISGDFAQRVEGPSGVELVAAAADTAIDASVRASYAAFSALAADWSGKVRRWRCGLSAAERSRLGVGKNW